MNIPGIIFKYTGNASSLFFYSYDTLKTYKLREEGDEYQGITSGNLSQSQTIVIPEAKLSTADYLSLIKLMKTIHPEEKFKLEKVDA